MSFTNISHKEVIMAIKEPASFVHSIQGIAQVTVRTLCPQCKSKALTYVDNVINPEIGRAHV